MFLKENVAQSDVSRPPNLRQIKGLDTLTVMGEKTPRPLIGIPVNLANDNPRRITRHTAGEKYIRAATLGAGGVAMLIPAAPELTDVDELVSRLDGLLLTGGRANVEPHHYGGKPFPEDEIVDPARDNTVLPLVRASIDRGVPVFGICRGHQEINVALGGTLHYRLHVLPDTMDHRRPQDTEEIDAWFGLRHDLALAAEGLLAGLIGTTETRVNSLHGQGVDRLAPGMVVEARAPDGVIESIRLDDPDRFCVGVQWHAEWNYDDHMLARALFEAFGEAARRYHARKTGRVAAPRVGRVA
jgi:putative glutamine amidotransferase